jgi:hypothetical protein
MINNNSGSSYNILIDRLEAFANGHKMINQFSHGSISLIDIPKENRYPVMHVAPGSITPMPGMMEYSFDVLFFDCPRAKEEKADYQREVISDMTRLALDLIAEIMNGNVLFNRDVELSGTSTIDPFVEDYSQVVTGVTLSLVLQVSYDWSACDIPADYAVGGNNTGGNGSRVGLVLKTNGTLNAVQSLLDLVEGTNINIEDLGDGRVRISATGGGGGSVNWGSIGGTLSAQTDLQTALDGKASDGELTTEVNARIAADTTLQNNINTVAGNLSTETTARQAGDATNAADLVAHTSNTSNPHATTKDQVGLGNVDNTSDANKPISSATQTALNAKEPTITAGTTSQYYRGDKTFQTLDKSAVGLGNVVNTDTSTTTNITDSVNKRFVTDANLTTIGNQSGVNTGDETTASIQSKRPLKTINGNSLEGSGNVVISAAVNQAFRTYGTGFTLAASSGDRWYVIQSGTNSGTESNVQVSAEFAMTFIEIRVRTTGTQSATGSLVFTLRKNGVDQFALTIAAGAAAGVYSATGSFSVVAGDLINFKIRNNATAISANIAQLSATYQ